MLLAVEAYTKKRYKDILCLSWTLPCDFEKFPTEQCKVYKTVKHSFENNLSILKHKNFTGCLLHNFYSTQAKRL